MGLNLPCRPIHSCAHLSCTLAFGEYGEGFVRIALVENEHRIRQAARNIRKFLSQTPATMHNVISLQQKASR